MHYIFIAWYLVATFAVSEAETEIDIPTPPEGYFHVTLLAYANLRDPVWKFGQCLNQCVQNLLLQARKNGYVYDFACIPKKTGFKGFIVQEATEEQLIVGHETTELQLLLLDTMPSELPPIGDYRQHIRSVIASGTVSPDCPDTTGNKSYELPYSLERWNANENIRRKNNGYNYVNNFMSNSYAQPGRASGQIYSQISGDQIRDAAVRDGLVVLSPHPAANDSVPANPDGDLYLVALFVAPGDCHMGGDFHWYRLDNNGIWSHKPGQAGATDLDDANRPITDPRTADTGVYKFVCFMVISQNTTFDTRACQEGDNSTFDQCGQRCTCQKGQLVDCVRIRKEFTSMKTEERKRYIRVIKTASTDPKFKRDYDLLINEHRELFHKGIHGPIHFLTWHRYYILRYENLLRRVDCRFTIAYWDWSTVANNAFRTTEPLDLWHSSDSGFGGNGEGRSRCVQTGPFKEGEWKLVPLFAGELVPRCLKRDFNGILPNTDKVKEALRTAAASFTDFEEKVRLFFHNEVHVRIGGTMKTEDAASAPEFFLHHGFIDKIWDDWQKKSENHKNEFFPTVPLQMPGTNVLPKKVVDLSSQPGNVRVEYQPNPSAAGGVNASIPCMPFSPLSNQTFQLFRLSQAEITRAKELEKMFQC